MNLKSKLAYMALGGVLVLAGHVLPGLVVGSATAQSGLQDVEFGKIKARSIELGDGPDGAWVHIGAGKKAATIILKAATGTGIAMLATEGEASVGISDDTSDERVVLAATRQSGSSMSISRGDTTLARVSTDDDGGLITVGQTDGIMAVGMSAMPTGGSVAVKQTDGTIAAVISAKSDGGIVGVFQPDGTTVAFITALSDGGAVVLSQPDGTPAAVVKASPTGGTVYVNQPDGTTVATMDAGENGGYVTVTDKYGEPEAGMAVDDNGDGFLIPSR